MSDSKQKDIKAILDFDTQPLLQTARLTLRKPVLTDAEAIADGLNDFSVARMLTRVPWPYDLPGAHWWLNQWLEGRQTGWCFAIAKRENPDELMGIVSAEPHERGYEMGWWLQRAHWNNGYMTEAVRAVVEHALASTDLDCIHCGAIFDNPASLRIQQKLGFATVGSRQGDCLSRGETVEVIRTRLDRNPSPPDAAMP